MRIQVGLRSIRRTFCHTRLGIRILEHILFFALRVVNTRQHIACALAVRALLRDQQPVRGIGRRVSGRCSRAYIRRAVKADLVSRYIRLARAVLLPHVACFLGGLTGGFRSGAALFCGLTGAFRTLSLLFRTRTCILRRFSCVLAAFAHSLRSGAVCLSRFPCILVCNSGILGRNAVCLGIRSAGLGRNTRRFILCTDALCVRPLAFCRHAGRFGVHSAGLSGNAALFCCVALVLRIGAGGLCLRTKVLCQYAGRLCRRSCGLCVRTVILRLHSQVFRCHSCGFCLNAQCFRARPVLRFILYENHVVNHCVYCICYTFPHKAVKLRLVFLCVAGQRVRQTDAAVFCNILCCDLVIGNSQCITSHLFRWCNA